MPSLLKQRNSALRERMDDPGCDPVKLKNTYRQFATLNRLISGWSSICKKMIRPAIIQSSGPVTVLDIGCGGGDLLRLLARLTSTDSEEVLFTGIDPDPRAIEFAKQRSTNGNITFEQATSAELVKSGRTFDFVISNHLLHHLTEAQLTSFCADAEKLATNRVLFSDIERSGIGYLLFSAIAPLLFRNSFIAEDGRTSIKRSYTKRELEQALPDGWSVKRKFPYRLLAVYKKEN